MKIVQQTQDFPEDTIKAFASFLGWSESVIQPVPTVQEDGTTIDVATSVPNPYTYLQFFSDRYNPPILNDLRAFQLQQAKATLKQAEVQVEAGLAGIVNLTTE